jgi:hypothetical protein
MCHLREVPSPRTAVLRRGLHLRRPHCGEVFETAETVPAGDFVTMYCDRMLDVRRQIQGDARTTSRCSTTYARGDTAYARDYLGEIIAESPAFPYEGRDMMFKLQIPVEVHHTNPLR